MLRKDIDSVVDLFGYSPVELHELYNLAASGQRKGEKEKLNTRMLHV